MFQSCAALRRPRGGTIQSGGKPPPAITRIDDRPTCLAGKRPGSCITSTPKLPARVSFTPGQTRRNGDNRPCQRLQGDNSRAGGAMVAPVPGRRWKPDIQLRPYKLVTPSRSPPPTSQVIPNRPPDRAGRFRRQQGANDCFAEAKQGAKSWQDSPQYVRERIHSRKSRTGNDERQATQDPFARSPAPPSQWRNLGISRQNGRVSSSGTNRSRLFP